MVKGGGDDMENMYDDDVDDDECEWNNNRCEYITPTVLWLWFLLFFFIYFAAHIHPKNDW